MISSMTPTPIVSERQPAGKFGIANCNTGRGQSLYGETTLSSLSSSMSLRSSIGNLRFLILSCRSLSFFCFSFSTFSFRSFSFCAAISAFDASFLTVAAFAADAKTLAFATAVAFLFLAFAADRFFFSVFSHTGLILNEDLILIKRFDFTPNLRVKFIFCFSFVGSMDGWLLMIHFWMAGDEDPVRSLSATMASWITCVYGIDVDFLFPPLEDTGSSLALIFRGVLSPVVPAISSSGSFAGVVAVVDDSAFDTGDSEYSATFE
mmetsp:Transcript_21873/g.52043  ORF Transcript_21873/g.52043 Transcript_21873/m.52043 type:complete len:263 (-) Transcript_21873:417-1205(-)